MAKRTESTATATPCCPCGSGQAYDLCCGVLHGGQAAPHAEALMRARYSAYVLNLADYLLASWHPDTRPMKADFNLHETTGTPPLKWLGLEVKRHVIQDDAHATVEFVARCKRAGRAERLHEISRFVREDGHWYYRDAET